MNKQTAFFMKQTPLSTPSTRDERQLRLAALLVLATLLDVGLILARDILAGLKRHQHSQTEWSDVAGWLGLPFGFLLWNLFLAWVPYLAALRFERLPAGSTSPLARWSWFALWLFFLPNAPYIMTDFIHLQHRPPVPVWYDMIMLFAFASTGLLLGLLSLHEVQRALRREFSVLFSQVLVLLSIGLSGFGVWLGRFQRWNSWDILTNPDGLLRDIVLTLTQRGELLKAVGVSGLIAGMLLVGYSVLVVLLSTGPQRQ